MTITKKFFDLTSRYHYLCGLLSFILYSLSFLIGKNEELSSSVYTLVRAGLIFVSAPLFCASCDRKCSDSTKTSFSVFSLVIFIYEVLLLAAVGKTIIYIRDYPAIMNSVLWTGVSFICFVRFRNDLFSFLSSLIKDRERIQLVISAAATALIVVALSVEPAGVRLSWDSDTLYDFIYSLDYDSLYDARQLMFMHVHVSIVYVYIIVLLKLLFHDLRLAFFIVNSLCIFSASFGMTFLLRSLIPKKKNMSYILANAVFLFSPWICGLSTYHIYDYFIYCLFPMMMYFLHKKNQIGFFCTGTMISFSRAPGLVIFGSVCLGILVVDFVKLASGESIKGFRNVFRLLLTRTRYLYFASVALIFVVYFYLGRDINRQFGDTKLGFAPDHILQLSKIYFLCNFLWIMSILAISFILFLLLSKKESRSSDIGSFVFIITFSDLILILFYFFLITYRIPRYMDSHISVLYILGTMMLLSINDKRISYSCLSFVCIVNLAASFLTFDPISLAVFNRIDVGDHFITDQEMGNNPSLEDSIICNREYYSYEVLLGKTLGYVMDDRSEKDEIMFSLGTQSNTWGFSGGRYSYIFEEGQHYFNEFYDRKINGLANGYSYSYFGADDMIPFEMHYIFPEENISQAILSGNADTFYYIYMPTLNSGKEKEIDENFDIISERDFSFHGWKMCCIKFRL